MKVVTVTNQKGGAGKTSTTLFLKSGLARKGNRILLIDLDQQADASFSYHVPYPDDATSLKVLTKQISIKDAIVQAAKNIDLVPASPYLSQLDLKLVGKYDDPQSILKHALQVVSGQYDYVTAFLEHGSIKCLDRITNGYSTDTSRHLLTKRAERTSSHSQ